MEEFFSLQEKLFGDISVMSDSPLLRRLAHPLRIAGPIIEAVLPGVKIGEVCEIRPHWRTTEIVARAQVMGF
ncbi:Probable ATP synthase SpaL [Serratia fonticola]|uniref:Probable ATP synthase SpaL n=1 Tax=Serratia fonticola TaxID=47917 RepID=A0A4U9USC5_SERFO|nr:Probable ATP synthase SpaL [Serratia fonticola]